MNNNNRTRIAVVEDDEPVLDAVQMVLANQGWLISTYTTGELFLHSLDHNHPDCLLLDPHLPGINGVEVLQSVNARFHQNRPSILVLTAQPNSPQVSELRRLGANEILLKPITEQALIDTVRAYIR